MVVAGVAVRVYITRLVSYEKMPDSLRLVEWGQQVLIYLFRLNVRTYRRRLVVLRGCEAQTLRSFLKIQRKNNSRGPVLLRAEEGVQRILEFTAERDDLLLGRKDYDVFNEHSERILSEQLVTVKPLTALVKQLEES